HKRLQTLIIPSRYIASTTWGPFKMAPLAKPISSWFRPAIHLENDHDLERETISADPIACFEYRFCFHFRLACVVRGVNSRRQAPSLPRLLYRAEAENWRHGSAMGKASAKISWLPRSLWKAMQADLRPPPGID